MEFDRCSTPLHLSTTSAPYPPLPSPPPNPLVPNHRAGYDKLISELGIRSVIAGDSHKAAQRVAAAAAGAN